MLVKEDSDVSIFRKKANKIIVYTNVTWRKLIEKDENDHDKVYHILLSDV